MRRFIPTMLIAVSLLAGTLSLSGCLVVPTRGHGHSGHDNRGHGHDRGHDRDHDHDRGGNHRH